MTLNELVELAQKNGLHPTDNPELCLSDGTPVLSAQIHEGAIYLSDQP